MKNWIYLDDIRTPAPVEGRKWIVVRDFYEFTEKIEEISLDEIEGISFDHDLGPQAMAEYYRNVRPNYELDYSHIDELTGYHACKWLVDHYYEKNPQRFEMDRQEKKTAPFIFPKLTVHSANPVGSANIMGYLNNFLKNEAQPQSCIRHFWELDPTSETI